MSIRNRRWHVELKRRRYNVGTAFPATMYGHADHTAQAIRDLAEQAATAPTAEAACQVVLDGFTRHLEADAAALLFTDRMGALRVGATSGLKTDQGAADRWTPWGEHPPDSPTPVVVARAAVARGAAPAALLDDHFQQAVFVPLILGGRLIGVVALYYAAPRALDPPTTALHEALALQAAVAMHHKQVEMSLQRRQQMLGHFVEDAPIGLQLLDGDGRIEWTNAAQLALLDYTAEEYVGRSLDEFLDDEGQRTAVQEVITAARNIDNLELSLRHKDGTGRWALLSVRHAWEDEDRTRICCFLRDITDRKRGQMEQQFLLESGQILASSLEYAQTLERLTRLAVPGHADWSLLDMAEEDGRARLVAVAHRDPTKAALLRQLREQYPVQPENGKTPVVEVLRTGRPVMVPTLDRESVRRYAHDANHLDIIRRLDPRSFLTVPLLLRGKAIGTLTWVRTAGRPPLDERDVVLAQELARSAVSAVEHARLYEEAQEANRLKDIFLANVSHELRTPMNAIMGWTTVLARQTPQDAATRPAIDAILRNAQVQARLIDDLLEVSRVVSGKLRLETVPFEVERPVLAAIETVRPAADAKRIAIHLHSECTGQTMTGDPDRLQQVFWNLLSNAIKFSAAGDQVTVRVGHAASELVVQVHDVGRGITPRLLPHVFDPFRQADTKPGQGLGLGLAIVRHLVEMHGGEVRAESAGEGLGATFTVTLPVDRA